MEDPEPTLAPEQLLAELGWIRALAYRLVADPNVADDVLQRVCLVALEKPPRHVSGTSGIRRWLSTLTRRTAAHVQRADQRRTRRERRAARGEALPPTVDLAARREVLHQLVDSLTDLEARDQELLTLRYFEGLGIGDIATRLEVTDEVVRKRLSRARQRLRVRLEAGAGPDRERWLAALAPVAPLVVGHLLPALPRVGPAREAAQTVLGNPLFSSTSGVLTMAKVASTLSVKLVVTLGLVTALVATAWQVLDPGNGETLQSPAAIPTVVAPVPEPHSLPMILEEDEPAPEPLAVEALVEEPMTGESTSVPTAVAASSGLAVILEDATASYLTGEPDLQALNDALRQLAYAASVIPGTVATDPTDGSVSGWVEIAGTELKGEWSLDADGRYSVEFGMVAGDDFPEHFFARDLRLAFQSDGGHASEVGTIVQFHPDTSEGNMAKFLESLDGQERHVGWHLEISSQGTMGSPITAREYRDKNSVMITASGGLPSLSESWANDTTPYDLWLALFAGHVP